MTRMLAIVLCVSLGTSACASAGGARYTAPAQTSATAPPSIVDPAIMAEFVQRIPAGKRVKVERTKGDTIHGTILKTSADALVVQRNTRLPEPPIEVPFATIARVTLDEGRGSSAAKAVGIGVASGVATFLGILAIIAASWD
jgi:hypothetical protein